MSKILDDQTRKELENPKGYIPSDKCYSLIKTFEGLQLTAYLCPAGIYTIGYGNTFYEDGKPVKKGDKVTKETAEHLLPLIVKKFAIDVNQAVTVNLRQHQFDALVSFCYNVGIGNFKSSTLLKRVNANAPMMAIKAEFLKWNRGGGKVLAGLTRRRNSEAFLYDTGILKFDF